MNSVLLSLNFNSKANLQKLGRKRVLLLLISLFCVLVLSSFFIISAFDGISFFATGKPDEIVSNETELKDAILAATEPIVIAFDSDIILTDSLVIPPDRDVTLTSVGDEFWALIGVNGQDTISVGVFGVLRLDGIVVTHVGDDGGRGVSVTDGGALFMLNGVISGNTVDYSLGGGVLVHSGGSFSMSGGEIIDNVGYDGGGVCSDGSFVMSGGVIANNVARNGGGGVWCWWSSDMVSNATGVPVEYGFDFDRFDGSFVMSGGVIANNSAILGGGVLVASSIGCLDVFVMSGGVIANNTASNGGGVFVSGAGVFVVDGGEISGNTALYYGGGVCVSECLFDNGTIVGFESLFVGKGVVFLNNSAGEAYSRDSLHDEVYVVQIKCTVWSVPFTQGYNNYDISYTRGTPLVD